MLRNQIYHMCSTSSFAVKNNSQDKTIGGQTHLPSLSPLFKTKLAQKFVDSADTCITCEQIPLREPLPCILQICNVRQLAFRTSWTRVTVMYENMTVYCSCDRNQASSYDPMSLLILEFVFFLNHIRIKGDTLTPQIKTRLPWTIYLCFFPKNKIR